MLERLINITCTPNENFFLWGARQTGKSTVLAIDSNASVNIHADHLKGLRALRIDHPECRRLLVVSLEATRRMTDDGILILPAREFVDDLWSDKLHH